MRRLALIATAGLVLTVALPDLLRGDLAPEQAQQVKALIAQFSAKEFAARQQAVEKLIAMGPDVLPLMKKTLAETKDNEVKLRCEMVIAVVAERQPSALATRTLNERIVKDLGEHMVPPAVQEVRSPNGEGVAYLFQPDFRGVRVVHNGREEAVYDSIQYPVALSRDGKRAAYAASKADKWFMVCDGIETAASGPTRYPLFSPDSKRLAYCALRGKKWFVVCDGKESVGYDLVWRKAFSPDSRHLAYHAMRDGKHFAIADSTEGPAHDLIWWLSGGVSDKLRYVTVDEGLASLMEVDWPAGEDDKPTVLAERRIKPLGAVPHPAEEYSNITSRYGDGLAFRVKRDTKMSIIREGRNLGTYDEIHWWQFSADGRNLIFLARDKGKSLVVYDGRESEPYDLVAQATFSPDGNHWAYAAKRGEKWLLVHDGKSSAEYDLVLPPVFSPDSKHLVFAARRGNDWFVICDARERRQADEVLTVRFSADNRHLISRVRRLQRKLEPEFSYMVIDGIPGTRHDLIEELPTEASNENAFRYIGIDKGRQTLIEVDWPKDLDWTNGMTPVEPEK